MTAVVLDRCGQPSSLWETSKLSLGPSFHFRSPPPPLVLSHGYCTARWWEISRLMRVKEEKHLGKRRGGWVMIKLIVDCYLMLGKHAGMHCSISAVIRQTVSKCTARQTKAVWIWYMTWKQGRRCDCVCFQYLYSNHIITKKLQFSCALLMKNVAYSIPSNHRFSQGSWRNTKSMKVLNSITHWQLPLYHIADTTEATFLLTEHCWY